MPSRTAGKSPRFAESIVRQCGLPDLDPPPSPQLLVTVVVDGAHTQRYASGNFVEMSDGKQPPNFGASVMRFADPKRCLARLRTME